MAAPEGPAPGRRILVRAPNWLGDMVMALPAVRLVRRAEPDARLAVAATAGAAALFSFVPDVDEVVSLPPAPRLGRPGRLARDADAIARAEADVALLLTNSFRSALTVWKAGVRERWGYRTDARQWLLTRAVPRRSARPRTPHHAEYYLALVRALGLAGDQEPVTDDRPYLSPTAEARADARTLLDARGGDRSAPLVGVAPGAAYGRAKQYPPHLMAGVIHALASRGWRTVLVGAAADRSVGRAIEQALGSMPVPDLEPLNLIGQTDLATLVGLIERCRAFVSNDSGAMHVAAGLGTPVVALFGSTDERATRPIGPHRLVSADVWCRPCLLRECPIDHRCMQEIAPARVVGAVAEVACATIRGGDEPGRAARS